jgi:hypothetical protein
MQFQAALRQPSLERFANTLRVISFRQCTNPSSAYRHHLRSGNKAARVAKSKAKLKVSASSAGSAEAVPDDDEESEEIEPPEVTEDNIMHGIGRMNANALFNRIVKLSALDREAAERISTEINRVMQKLRSILSTLEKKDCGAELVPAFKGAAIAAKNAAPQTAAKNDRQLLALKCAAEQEEQVLSFERYREKFDISDVSDSEITDAWRVLMKFDSDVVGPVEELADDYDQKTDDPVREYFKTIDALGRKLNDTLSSSVRAVDLSIAMEDAEMARLEAEDEAAEQRAKQQPPQPPLAIGDRVRHVTSGGTGIVIVDDVEGRASYCSLRSDKDGRVVAVDRAYLEKLPA